MSISYLVYTVVLNEDRGQIPTFSVRLSQEICLKLKQQDKIDLMLHFAKNLFLSTAILVITMASAQAQFLYAGLDWKIAAVVSSSDYTNGAATGDPGLTLGVDFDVAALEFGFVRYTLKNEVDDFRGETELQINDLQLSLGARLKHGPFFFSRIGLIYHDIETESENNRGTELEFSHDGSTIGLYLGGGMELPFNDRFAFQTSINLETANKDITIFSLYLGFKIRLADL